MTPTCPTCGVSILEHPAGRCLDAWVAERVMGLDTSAHLEVRYEEGNTPDGKDGWSGFICPRCHNPEDMLDTEPCCKHYSTSIAYALKALDEMKLSGWDIFMENAAHNRIRKNEWWCMLDNNKCEIGYSASCPELPLAICRASILAMEEK